MTPTRIVVLVVAAFVAGCSKPPRPKGTAADQPANPAAAPAPTGDPKADAAAFARHFLKAVSDGTATPAMLTPEFKKVIAESVFPSDEAQGYSDAAAEQWLRSQRELAGFDLPRVETDDGKIALLKCVPSLHDRIHVNHALLRLVRDGGDWRVDWAGYSVSFSSNSRVGLSGDGPPGVTHDQAAAGFGARAFLLSLLAKRDRDAEGLMTQRYKAALAPPLSTDKRGFNRGLLVAKLASFRGRFTGDQLREVALTGNTGAVRGELCDNDGLKPFTLKLVKGDRPWDWLVDEFKAE